MTDLPNPDETTLLDLLPDYALGALSELDRARVEVFLEHSEAARTELHTYQAMLVDMAGSMPLRHAPPTLTNDFRVRLAAESAPKILDLTAKPIIAKPRRTRTRTIPLKWLAPMAALLVIGLAFFGLYRIATQKSDQQEIQAILADSSAIHLDLAPQKAGVGTVTYVHVPNSDKGVLIAQMPPLPSFRQYQLWFVKGSTPDSALVFSTPSDAAYTTFQVLVTIPNPSATYDLLGISIEPVGGSKTPSGKPILLVKFKQ